MRGQMATFRWPHLLDMFLLLLDFHESTTSLLTKLSDFQGKNDVPHQGFGEQTKTIMKVPGITKVLVHPLENT